MRKTIISILSVAFTFASISALQAQTAQNGRSGRSHSSSQRGFGHSTNGPNAAFKNQKRKFTDPLNANGK